MPVQKRSIWIISTKHFIEQYSRSALIRMFLGWSACTSRPCFLASVFFALYLLSSAINNHFWSEIKVIRSVIECCNLWMCEAIHRMNTQKKPTRVHRQIHEHCCSIFVSRFFLPLPPRLRGKTSPRPVRVLSTTAEIHQHVRVYHRQCPSPHQLRVRYRSI